MARDTQEIPTDMLGELLATVLATKMTKDLAMVTSSREIYSRAYEALEDGRFKDLADKCAELEKMLKDFVDKDADEEYRIVE